MSSHFSGFLYAVGGYDGSSRQCLSSVECYNPAEDKWSLVAEMSCRRSGAGKIIVLISQISNRDHILEF